ncbi:MAG: hypothetical protein QNJ38_20490 [Prochloraceae cyanobacterium]|nr:hypothetical protein [Prochloraceae cyanobacterium]
MNLKKIYSLLIPGIILQSVLIGGGFATGREIVEYGGKFGPTGLITGITILAGFTLTAFLTFEICRLNKVYDYKSLLKVLIGPFWFIYEIIYLGLAVLIIAVMASAAGEMLQQIFGLNYWIGVGMVVVLVGFINLKGEDFLVRMKSIGTIALFIAYTLFGISVFLQNKNNVFTVFNSFVNGNGEYHSIVTLVVTGILYVGYNLVVYPASLFSIRQLNSRKDTLLSAIFAGALMTIPWFLTFIALLGYYPNRAIFEAPIPWLEMLKSFSNFYILIFGVVVGWTLVETATGMIHGFISRLSEDLKFKNNSELSGKHKSIISIFILTIALVLSQVGIIDLIAKGYLAMSYAAIACYAVPLLFHGLKIATENYLAKKETNKIT